MKHAPSSRSHAATWIVIVLAVPVLYVLALPPFVFSSLRAGLWSPYHMPAWLPVVTAPYHWLGFNTPLKKPLNAYTNWWAAKMNIDFP